jgi:O-antigen/teichoic acid export membrane protein
MKDFLQKAGKHTAVFGLGDVAQKFVGFILLPVYMRRLTPEDYGVLAMLSVMSMLCGHLILQGLPTASFRAYSFDYSDDDKAQRQVVSSAYLYLLLSASLFYSLLFLLSPFISNIAFKHGDFTRFLRIVFITDFLACSSYIPSVILRARLLSLLASVITLARVVMGSGLIIWFVVFRDMKLEGILMANLIMSIVVFVTSPLIPICIHKGFAFRISWKKIRDMLAFGLPFVPNAFGIWLLSSADRFFLEHFCERSELGLYSIAFQFSSILSFLFLDPFKRAWPAIFYPKAKDSDAKETFSRFLTYFLLFGSAIGLCIILGAENLIRVMGPKEYWHAYTVVPILVFSILLGTNGLQNLVNIGLVLKKKTKYAPTIVIFGAALNILFNVIFVPRYGMIGAAFGTLFSALSMLVLAFRINQTFYPLSYERDRLLHIVTAFLAIIVLNAVVRVESFLLAVPIKLLLFIAFISLLYLTKFFKSDEIEYAKKSLGRLFLDSYTHKTSPPLS